MASKLNANQIELGKFYKPYLSDEEDDSSQDSYNSGSESESESGASSVASLPPPSQSRQNTFVSSGAPISSGGEKPPEQLTDPTQMFKQTKTAFTGSKNTTTIMINSSDRDTKTFPQPTFFTLRLPRIYRNVVGISVTQIKMLSSFYYFAAAKSNTSLRIQEAGRTRTVDGKTVDNPITVYIRDGTYDAGSLINELNNQLNRTPIYNRISFGDFTSGFITTGNFSPLFNDPGDTTYNPVTGIFEALPSKADLLARYFKSGSNLGVQYYSADETMVAYYYPMLKDLTIGQLPTVTALPESPFTKRCTTYVESGGKTYDSLNYFKTDPTALSYLVGTNYYDRIVYGFQGLTDPYITYVLSDPANRAILQKYKEDNTWDGYLVNKYVCSYDSTVGRMTIYSAGLNTSLVTTLNAQFQDILVRELVKQNITPDQVAGLQTLGENFNGVVIDMYNTIQRAFTNYFAVSYGSYAPIFYTNLNNELDLADASGRYGWNLTYSGGSQLLNNTVTYPDASGYWPRVTFTPEGFTVSGEDLYYPIVYLPDLSGGGKPQARYTYTHRAVSDASDNLILNEANEESLGYQDISFNIMPTAYTRVLFKTRCRQQLFIETIPPFEAEIPPNNLPSETYLLSPAATPFLFNDDIGKDCRLDPIAPDFIFFDISQNMFDGPQFMRRSVPVLPGQQFQFFIREVKPIATPLSVVSQGYIGLYTFRPHVFFRIQHGAYLVPYNYGLPEGQNANTKFRSDIYIEREDSQAFGADLDFYWYRNRAAYMTDVSNALVNPLSTPRPKHYFIRASISKDVSSARITTDFISYESSYCMIKAKGTLFPNQTLRIFVLKHDPYGVYTYPSAADYRQMPVDLNYLKTKSTPITNFPTPYNSLFNSKKFRNTYDLSGVSNNLLDHFVITTDFSHYDPYDFTDNTTIAESPLRFTFQFKTKAIGPPVGADAWSQYYFNGSANAIVDTKMGETYYDSTIAAAEIAGGGLKGISNEFLFTNWFSAGAINNLYKPSLSPLSIPEQTIATIPSDFNDPNSLFTIISPIQYPPGTWLGDESIEGTASYKLSPFIICKNSVNINTDISFNDLNGHLNQRQIYLGQDIDPSGVNIKEIMAIPFTPPLGRYVLPTRVVLKFAYIQPSYTIQGVRINRLAPIGSNIRDPARYQTQSTKAEYGRVDEDNLMWDDHYWQNRRNVMLGIYRTRDIMGVNVNTISPADALCTLTLKKVVQIGQYTSSTDPNISNTRNRTPEWGTYYVYTMNDKPSDLWFAWGLETGEVDPYKGPLGVPRWAAISKPADLSGNIFMKNWSSGNDLGSYYSDVSNNSLCFIPFAPVLTDSEKVDSQDRSTTVAPFTKSISDNASWEVGSFSGLTYTTRPYLPITRSQTLGENPYIFYNPGGGSEAVCVEEIGNDGISMGDTSTYLGTAGPFCLGKTTGGTVVSPNYRKNAAFKPTFFNIRINLRISDTLYNPLFDMAKFGGYNQASSCYVDTQTYFYDISNNPTSALNDITSAWGSEKASRFQRFDDDSGFNYLSYMPTVNLTANHLYQINIRGYVPTVKFLSGVRLVGKNWTDFGRISFNDLINEIAAINNAGITIQPDGRLSNNAKRLKLFFTYDYTRTLLLFDKQFTGTFVFGRGVINPTYPGQEVISTGFGDFMTKFIRFNTDIRDLVDGITTASNAALTAVRRYIATNYSGILPDVVLQRNRFTDPLTYSIQFKSALKDPYATAYDQWGLGWNLGFDKIDSIYNTRHVAITFIRIVDDYIYLKLDDELNINNIDISYKEDLSLSRDTAGQSKRYYGKLLLNAFGSFAQTFIQSAKAFTIPIGRLDKLTFELVDAYNRQLSNNDCEYNIVLGIDEMVDTVDTASIVVKGT